MAYKAWAENLLNKVRGSTIRTLCLSVSNLAAIKAYLRTVTILNGMPQFPAAIAFDLTRRFAALAAPE